jgi:long-chain acyl-CoA synthetase
MQANGGPRPAPGTLTRIFFDAVERFDLPAAYQYKKDGAYRSISHRETLQRARHVSLGLAALGVRRGDRVGIMSENRPEWAIADWACLGGGMTDVPIYPRSPPSRSCIRSTTRVPSRCSSPRRSSAPRRPRCATRCKTVKWIISFTEPAPDGCDMTFGELETRGAALDSDAKAAEWRAGALAVSPTTSRRSSTRRAPPASPRA